MLLKVETSVYRIEYENMIAVKVHMEAIDKEKACICLLGFFTGKDAVYAECIASFNELSTAYDVYERIEAALMDGLAELEIRV
ncbi:MAG: hypothetical protein IJ405_07130 [Lachnospiraceae bacterium]|nr:hypothetical protein [Lachnospiraceae bacterium]